MSTVVIVDTDVVSFLFKGDTRAQLYRPHLQGKTLALSFMTVCVPHLATRLYAESAVRVKAKEPFGFHQAAPLLFYGKVGAMGIHSRTTSSNFKEMTLEMLSSPMEMP